MITFGSGCSGIEAASVAWEPIGFKPVWFSQFDPEHDYSKGPDDPSAVLQHHWPHVPNLGDLTTVRHQIELGYEAPDVFVAGTPCQAYSVAGMREGLSDERGALTLEYVKILDTIDEQRKQQGKPACIGLWENVPGVLSMQDNAFGCLLGGLAGEDCELVPPGKRGPNAGCVFGPKRTVAWRILDAQYFGVAQRRRRVFVVSSARDGVDPVEILLEFEGLRRDSDPRNEKEEIVAALTANGVGTCGADDNQAQAGHLIPVAGYRMVAFGEYADDNTASCMKARDYKDATDLVVMTVHGTQDPDVNMDVAHTLGRNQGQENAVLVPSRVRRLTPIECERLQGFPENKINVMVSVSNDGEDDVLCSDHQKKSVRVGTKNPKLLKYALNVEGEKLLQNAKHAAKASSVSLDESSEPAAVYVLIDLERQRLQLRSAEKSILSVSIAGEQSESLLPIPPGDFARVAALMTQEAVKITRTGKAESQDCGTSFSIQKNGRILSALSGREIDELASDAALFTNVVSEHLKFITSPAGQNSLTSEQMFAISSCFVAAAMNGFIPEEMRSASSFDLKVTVSHGHTNIPVNGKPAADGHRYKALGNSMATVVMQWIGKRIKNQIEYSEFDNL